MAAKKPVAILSIVGLPHTKKSLVWGEIKATCSQSFDNRSIRFVPTEELGMSPNELGHIQDQLFAAKSSDAAMLLYHWMLCKRDHLVKFIDTDVDPGDILIWEMDLFYFFKVSSLYDYYVNILFPSCYYFILDSYCLQSLPFYLSETVSFTIFI